jgi:hypothetical protein
MFMGSDEGYIYRYHTNSPNDIPIQERPDGTHWPEHSEKVQSRRFD